jgi:hypothetical protein
MYFSSWSGTYRTTAQSRLEHVCLRAPVLRITYLLQHLLGQNGELLVGATVQYMQHNENSGRKTQYNSRALTARTARCRARPPCRRPSGCPCRRPARSCLQQRVGEQYEGAFNYGSQLLLLRRLVALNRHRIARTPSERCCSRHSMQRRTGEVGRSHAHDDDGDRMSGRLHDGGLRTHDTIHERAISFEE